MTDRLGQIIFRLETNMTFIARRLPPTDKGNVEAVRSIMADLEKLKVLKGDMGVAVERLTALQHNLETFGQRLGVIT